MTPTLIQPNDPTDGNVGDKHAREEAVKSNVDQHATVVERATFSFLHSPAAKRKRPFVSRVDAQVTHHLKQAGDALQMLTTKGIQS